MMDRQKSNAVQIVDSGPSSSPSASASVRPAMPEAKTRKGTKAVSIDDQSEIIGEGGDGCYRETQVVNLMMRNKFGVG